MSNSAENLPSNAPKLSKADEIEVSVRLFARDEVHLKLQVTEGEIHKAELKGVGCLELLQLLSAWRPKMTGQLEQIELPEGTGHAAILLREVILKAQGKWAYPYKEEEICHCRAVSTKVVDAAIVGGCHTPAAVSRATSASTSCGTCRSDVERILDYRLNRKRVAAF